MIFVYSTLAKIIASIGLGGAIIFAFTDSVVAATIAAIGTILAALIGLINTLMLGKVYDVARQNKYNVEEVKGVVNRRYEEVHPPPDGEYKRKQDDDAS